MSRSFTNIDLNVASGVHYLTLNRPDRLNCLDREVVAEINAVLSDVEAADKPRALVITATGRAFSAGAALKAEAGGEIVELDATLYGAISSMLSRIEKLPVPVIAVVDGIAVAGGLEILLVCDIVLASDRSVIGDVHAKYGLLPGGGGSVRLPRRVGVARAKYLMMTARTFPAQTMKEWGLVNEVVSVEYLNSALETLLADLTVRSPLGLSRMKQMIDNSIAVPRESALAAENLMCRLHDMSYDRNEGLRAFIEKRTPVFEGR